MVVTYMPGTLEDVDEAILVPTPFF